LETLKKKDGEFYQKAYKKAVEQAGFEIVDPKKDKIQRGLTQARNSLREARANLQTRQAIRSEAVNRARNDLIQQTRNISSQVLREQQNAITQYQNTRTRAQNRVSQARQTLTNVQQRSLGTINQGLATVRSVDSAISSAQNLASTLNSRQLGLQLASELTNQLSVGQ
jgi:F0F1-type ATP synthase membrane subunit b/b'